MSFGDGLLDSNGDEVAYKNLRNLCAHSSVKDFKVGLRFLRGPRSLLASLHVICHSYSGVGFPQWRH
jgi:hypothetical protein